MCIRDSGYAESGGIWNVVAVGNVDNDSQLEVLYTSSTPLAGGDIFTPDFSPPIVVMDPKGGVSIDDYVHRILPLDFKLNQNYPNPFNPTTTISFTLPQAEQVTLVIYDMMGRQVKELTNSHLSAGDHAFVWDATDMTGRKVASGVYLYHLRAGNMNKIRRMTLLK